MHANADDFGDAMTERLDSKSPSAPGQTFKARRDAELRKGSFAIPQPKLCAEMPHNLAPFKGGVLCVRCGVSG